MDLAGYDRRHEKRQRGDREEQVDLTAPDAEHGRDRAQDHEDPEQSARFPAGGQGEDDAEQGAHANHEQGFQQGKPAEPAQQR
jgi:hypothetical protein